MLEPRNELVIFYFHRPFSPEIVMSLGGGSLGGGDILARKPQSSSPEVKKGITFSCRAARLSRDDDEAALSTAALMALGGVTSFAH